MSGSDTRTCFLTDQSNIGECYQNRSDSQSSSAMSVTSKCNYFPVTKFGVMQTPSTFTGQVTDENGSPLEGVTVTLTSVPENGEGAPRRAATTGPAVYTATTDADGNFSVEVVQSSKIYNAEFALEGYQSQTVEGIDFANGNVVLEDPIVMILDAATGLSNLNAGKQVANVKYINVAGQMSDRAFSGVNIMVVTYSDGTTSTVKVVK